MQIKDGISNMIIASIQGGENIEIIVLNLLQEARKVNEISLNNTNFVQIAKNVEESPIKENPYIGLGGPTWKGGRTVF